jgi:hypothetical protein
VGENGPICAFFPMLDRVATVYGLTVRALATTTSVSTRAHVDDAPGPDAASPRSTRRSLDGGVGRDGHARVDARARALTVTPAEAVRVGDAREELLFDPRARRGR